MKVAVAVPRLQVAKETALEQQARVGRTQVTAKALEMILGEDRVAIACELAAARSCTTVDVVCRAFDEHATKSGNGEAVERTRHRKRRG